MSKSLSFDDVVVATAKQKHDAATARSRTLVADQPKEIILRVCQIIADELKGDGFSFLKSRRMLKRIQGDRVFKIWFQSDRNNISGSRAAVWIHADIQCVVSSEIVAGGQIGNLLPNPTWMEWDFAAEDVREREIDDAIAAIRRIILPFFASSGI